MKTKEQELVELLDLVFDDNEEPDWSVVIERCYLSNHGAWLMTEVLALLWLCSEDQAAFDEAIWILTNETQ